MVFGRVGVEAASTNEAKTKEEVMLFSLVLWI